MAPARNAPMLSVSFRSDPIDGDDEAKEAWISSEQNVRRTGDKDS